MVIYKIKCFESRYMVRKSGKENQTEKPVTLTVPNSECKS